MKTALIALIAFCLGGAVVFGVSERRISADNAQLAAKDKTINQLRGNLTAMEAQNMQLHNLLMDSVQTTTQLRSDVESKTDAFESAVHDANTVADRLNSCEVAARALQSQQQQGQLGPQTAPIVAALIKAFLR